MSGSVWEATMPAAERFSDAIPLAGDLHADVTIVGAGYTGLWTAYYLAIADPTLRIHVVEADTVGAGASGRNGGWCSSLLPMSLRQLSARDGKYAATAMQQAMFATVDEVQRVTTAEGIDAGLARGGTISLARNAEQERRLVAQLAEARRFRVEEADLRWLTEAEARSRCSATNVRAGLFTPHCAAVHPLRLVHGVARAAAARGVVIHEHTAARAVRPERVETDGATIRSEVVVLATEAYTSQLAGRRRDVLPIYSMMVATEPLPEATWAAIGLDGRPTFHDARHLVIYGQRTADGRLAFGGRGAPYHFRSRIDARFDTDGGVRSKLVASARSLFPVLADVDFPFHWGGPLGVSRDWHCAVQFDRRSRLALAGGYAGDGLATANLAGRTLAELITGQESTLTQLPWVGHRSPPWAVEPLRWLGVNTSRLAAGRADRAEAGTSALARRRAAGWRRLLGVVSGR